MTKREMELELELWTSRLETVKANANALQAQGQLLNIQAKECQDNIKRLQASLPSAEGANNGATPEAQAEPAPA